MSKLALLMQSGLVGDPFVHGKLFGWGARAVKGAIGLVRRRPATAIVAATAPIVAAGGRVLRGRAGSILAGGAAGAAGATLLGAGGEMIMGRRRRGRGITSRELRGFRKVTNLLRKVGMVPKGLSRSRRKVC